MVITFKSVPVPAESSGVLGAIETPFAAVETIRRTYQVPMLTRSPNISENIDIYDYQFPSYTSGRPSTEFKRSRTCACHRSLRDSAIVHRIRADRPKKPDRSAEFGARYPSRKF